MLRAAFSGFVLMSCRFFYLVAFFASLTTLAGHASANRLMPGGSGSTSYNSQRPILQPMANLDGQKKTKFYAGKALATQPWVKAPTITTARDGLGPLYNARTCLTCHVNGLRGVQPENPEDGMTALVKISLPGKDLANGAVPDPVYGEQIQTHSTDFFSKFPSAANADKVQIPPEAKTSLRWSEHDFEYPDGTRVRLRKPDLKIDDWGYGQPNKNLIYSVRNAPKLFGVGLLELINEEKILANADPQDGNKDGISGRVNRVSNKKSQRYSVGRFGWKANRAAVKHITAAAFVNDIGITSGVFSEENCTARQKKCKEVATRDHPDIEISDHLLSLTSYFVEHIAVPKAKPLTEQGQKGGELFTQIGCSSCHHPSYTTQQNADKPFLAEQKIWPYTDLLLHDMGEGLADGREEFEASGSEWRTAPLWGMSADPNIRKGNGYLLHDGRARTIEEAILWHGGEARKVTDAFVNLSQQQRLQLIEFVSSL